MDLDVLRDEVRAKHEQLWPKALERSQAEVARGRERVSRVVNDCRDREALKTRVPSEATSIAQASVSKAAYELGAPLRACLGLAHKGVVDQFESHCEHRRWRRSLAGLWTWKGFLLAVIASIVATGIYIWLGTQVPGFNYELASNWKSLLARRGEHGLVLSFWTFALSYIVCAGLSSVAAWDRSPIPSLDSPMIDTLPGLGDGPTARTYGAIPLDSFAPFLAAGVGQGLSGSVAAASFAPLGGGLLRSFGAVAVFKIGESLWDKLFGKSAEELQRSILGEIDPPLQKVGEEIRHGAEDIRLAQLRHAVEWLDSRWLRYSRYVGE